MPPPAPHANRGRARSHNRALAIGLAVSAVFHLLLLLFALHTRVEMRPVSEVSPRVAVSDGQRRVMRVERIVPVPSDAASRFEDPVDPEREEPRSEPVGEERPEPAVDAPAQRNPWADVPPAERLRPRMADPRLWTRPDAPDLPEPTDLERVHARIADRLGAWNDSVAAEAERAANARDWTFEDKDGGRWGVSPGKVHLGGITLPLPVNLGPPPWQREEASERARRDGEIADQEARERASENREDRIRAIRERRDKEREQKKKNGSGTELEEGP